MDLNNDITQQPAYDDYLRAPSREKFGLAIGVLVATVLYCTGITLTKSYDAAFFAAPIVVGAVVGLFSHRRPIRGAVYTILLALALAVVTLREGVICCLMAMPLVLGMTIVGALCGATIRRFIRGRRARAALAGFLVALTVAWQGIDGALDVPLRHPVHTATSSIDIPADPMRVFAALTAPELEVRNDWPWFMRIGLPMPGRISIRPPIEGGTVTGTFSQGVAHGHVREWEPGFSLAFSIDRYDITDLPFHITRLGRSPTYGLRAERVEDWLRILGVRFDLVRTADGGTTLVREVMWQRHLAPDFYFAWLQQTIMQRAQDRLLALFRERVPTAVPVDAAIAERVKPSGPRL